MYRAFQQRNPVSEKPGDPAENRGGGTIAQARKGDAEAAEFAAGCPVGDGCAETHLDVLGGVPDGAGEDHSGRVGVVVDHGEVHVEQGGGSTVKLSRREMARAGLARADEWLIVFPKRPGGPVVTVSGASGTPAADAGYSPRGLIVISTANAGAVTGSFIFISTADAGQPLGSFVA